MTQKFVASKHGLVSWEPCINGIIWGRILAADGRWQMNDVEVVKGQGRALTAAECDKLAEVSPLKSSGLPISAIPIPGPPRNMTSRSFAGLWGLSGWRSSGPSPGRM